MTHKDRTIQQGMYHPAMNTETKVVTLARNAVLEAASRLATIQSGIRFARENIAEVSVAECKQLLADCEIASAEVERLCKIYDKAVQKAEREAAR